MDNVVSAAEANRRFSHILRDVSGGETYVVTAHGKPVARIIPCASVDSDRQAARAKLFARLSNQPATECKPWSREELYER